MKIKLHIPLSPEQKQGISACVMFFLGVAVIAGTQNYIPKETAATAALVTASTQAGTAGTEAAPEPSEKAGEAAPQYPQQEEQPEAEADLRSSVRLNMAFEYPEGADTGDVSDSWAGQACAALAELDSEWMSGIYANLHLSPQEMAGRLGIGRNAILGLYNVTDKSQTADNPDSWVISSWKKKHVSFYDGDKNQISGYSNAKEIISMASVYAYRLGIEDGDAFTEYCTQLWKASHRYSVHIGNVYYCDGSCRTEDEETGESESETGSAAESTTADTAVAADTAAANTAAASDTAAAVGDTAATEPAAAETAVQGPAAETAAAEPAATDTAAAQAGASETAAAETAATESAAPAEPAITEPATAGPAGSAEPAAQPAAQEPAATEPAAAETAAAETTAAETPAAQESSDAGSAKSSNRYTIDDVPADWQSIKGPERDIWESVVAAHGGDTGGEASLPAASTSAVVEDKVLCPGHIDLTVQAVIVGLDENHSLFDVDTAGKSASESGEWSGWTKLNKNHVHCIQNQDWEAAYHLPVVTTMYMGNPLSAAEISTYMTMLPSGTTATQKNLIMQALESVGYIPYYWGGKPSAAGFDGNNFGAVILEDENGRNLRGLDCSGWVNWLYWTALGTPLSYESTSGLIQCGSSIQRADLQPGDIIVRTGADSHVYLFMCWAPDGSMYVIHETGGITNNVTVSKVNVHWPYYRRLLIE